MGSDSDSAVQCKHQLVFPGHSLPHTNLLHQLRGNLEQRGRQWTRARCPGHYYQSASVSCSCYHPPPPSTPSASPPASPSSAPSQPPPCRAALISVRWRGLTT